MPDVFKPDIKVDRRKTDDIVTGIRYVSSVPFVRKAFATDKIKARLLDHLRSIFPVSDRPDHKKHLVTGFRTYDIPSLQNKVGFVLQHRDIKQIRIQAILMSLESGSRGYYRYPTEADEEGFGVFSFFPGKFSGGKWDFATRKRIHIPRRSGGHHMENTMKFAEKLIMEAKPEFFKKVKDAVKRGKRA